MRVEVSIAKSKKLPVGALPAFENEFRDRLERRYDNCALSIRLRSEDGLSVSGASDDEKEQVMELLQETWESADDWFF